MNSLAVVVPCYNEAASLANLYLNISKELNPILKDKQEWKLILVDDGSSDQTANEIRKLVAQDPTHVKSVIFSRNFGKEAAMLAGLHRAVKFDATVIMDADLQHPPSLIPQMLQILKTEQVDQVVARRDRKGEKWIRKILTKLYYRGINSMVENIKLIDGEGDYRILSQRAVKALVSLGEATRFSKGLFSWIGFPTATIEYSNQCRENGQSSWSFKALFNYGLDGVMSFNTRPLRIAAKIGTFIFSAAVLYLIYLFIQWLIVGVTVPGYLTLIAMIVCLSGIELFFLGIVGEYIGRIYLEVKRRPPYLVKEESDLVNKDNI